jgi:bifunctional non-homologous end joining protein LigD
MARAAEHHMEGIVAKRPDSPYRPGRSNLWIKTPVRATAELVIVGFWCSSGPGGQASVGSLLVAGHNDSGQLVVVGQVGTGFSSAARRRLFELLQPIECARAPVANPPELRDIRWVRPVYVGEVAYREYVPGRWLRHTSWKGLRDRRLASIGLPRSS